MTKEEKDILMKDLCARLPYGVMVGDIYGNKNKVVEVNCDYGIMRLADENGEYFESSVLTHKPLLIPMNDDIAEKIGFELGTALFNLTEGNVDFRKFLDVIYENHIDFFGLIKKGLAISATKEQLNLK
jgi:hypothetical protein